MRIDGFGAAQAVVSPAERQYSASTGSDKQLAELDQQPSSSLILKLCAENKRDRWSAPQLGDPAKTKKTHASLKKLNKWVSPGTSRFGRPANQLNPEHSSNNKVDDKLSPRPTTFAVSNNHDENFFGAGEFIDVELNASCATEKKQWTPVESYLPTRRVSKYVVASVSIASVLALAALNLQLAHGGDAPLSTPLGLGHGERPTPSPWALAAGCLTFLTVGASLFIRTFARPRLPAGLPYSAVHATGQARKSSDQNLRYASNGLQNRTRSVCRPHWMIAL